MLVSFGVFYQCYRTVFYKVPDELKDADDEEIQNYIRDNWKDVPLPDGDYVPESVEPDFDNFNIIK